MNRFDNRNLNTFKKDIKFGTMLEKYFFHKWLDKCELNISDWSDNGCDNNGEFIAKGNTSGADYRATIQGFDTPLEIKWVPTAGKFSLKKHDLEAYIRERASILFIYNTGTANLRKPKDYDLDKHIKKIEANEPDIRWGLMWADKVVSLYRFATNNNLFEPIYYMGNKPGIILKSKDFHHYFTESKWS